MTTQAAALSWRFTRSPTAVGILLVVVSTAAIAIVPSFARLAYDGGSNPLTLITVRSLVTVMVGLMMLLPTRGWRRIARRDLGICLTAGVCYAVMLYGFLAAVRYLPVNTVILIYFFHPVALALVAARLSHERVTGAMMLALAAALVGLSLAVGLSFERPSGIGLALAALAMIACVLVLLLCGRAAKAVGGLAIVFYMMLAASAALGVLFLLVGEPRLPIGTAGWMGFVGVAVRSTLGTFTFFCAVPMIGIVRATMISNLEPLLGILFAVALLGEGLSLPQKVGIALVLGSIVAMERSRQPARDAE